MRQRNGEQPEMSYTSSKIEYPGLGIGEFTIDRVAFTVFGKPVAWYGILIATGMILAILYIMYRVKEYKGITGDDIIDFSLFVVIAGVIGARLYYVITSDRDYSFAEIFAIWEGGLAIYGGIIAGGITALLVCRYKKIRYQCFFDMLAPAVMIGQIIGRWGNFCNGEAFGTATESFLRMKLTHVYPSGSEFYVGMVHPTFLYESLWNLVGFILLNVFYRKRKFDGQIVLGYIAWYGFGRMFIEGLRTDSLYVGPFRISQVVGLLSFLAATGVMIYILVSGKGKRYDSASYKEVQESASENGTPVTNDEETVSEEPEVSEFKELSENQLKSESKSESESESKSETILFKSETKLKSESGSESGITTSDNGVDSAEREKADSGSAGKDGK